MDVRGQVPPLRQILGGLTGGMLLALIVIQAADLNRVAAEVVTAHTQVQTRASRIEVTRAGIQAAEEPFRLNWDRIQNAQGLPIEVLQSIQSLALLRREYLNAVVDYNIAQFQLWWAAGWFCEPVAAPPLAE